MEHSTNSWMVDAPMGQVVTARHSRFQVGQAVRMVGYIPILIGGIGLSFLLKLPGLLINGVFSAEFLQQSQDLATVADPLYQTIVGTTLLVIALVLGAVTARQTWAKNSLAWSTSCPCCGRDELARRKRRISHRVSAALVQLPLHRYGCNSCEWSGLRLDRSLL